MLPAKEDFQQFPIFAPLLAAILAPLSTLLDIPALTEPWFFQRTGSPSDSNGGLTALRDPSANLTLSAVGLAANVIANALLIVRFSVKDRWWRNATKLSLVCWLIKFGIAMGNVLAFGILSRNDPGISYGEGFWCAVVSLIVSLFILFFLVVHYLFQYRPNGGRKAHTSPTQLNVRIAGRQFMLQTQLFVTNIALLALFMSRLEAWTYLQGIYFSVPTILTVGLGDFAPTRPVTRALLFPAVLAGIVQLAGLVDLIARFFSSRMAARHARRRAAFQRAREEAQITQMNAGKGKEKGQEPDLVAELRFLQGLYERTHRWETISDLGAGLFGFLTFWVLGAVIFSQIENWTYGDGLYFCYIFFLSVGYGDFAPVTPAGRVVFVVYSLLAVPIMTSFAIQTIQNLLNSALLGRLERRRAEAGLDVDPIDGGVTDDAGAFRGAEDAESSEDDGCVDENRAIATGDGDEDDEEERLPKDVRRRLHQADARLRHHKEDDIDGAANGYWKRPHAYYLDRGHRHAKERLEKGGFLRSQKKSSSSSEAADVPAEKGRNDENQEDGNAAQSKEEQPSTREKRDQLEERDERADRVLTEYVLELAVEMEQHARRLLLASMPEGSRGRLVLQADRVVQLRHIRALAGQESPDAEDAESEADEENSASSDQQNGTDRIAGDTKEKQDADVKKEKNDIRAIAGSKESKSKKNRERPAMNALMRKYLAEEADLLPGPTDLDERETLEEVTRYRAAFAGILAAGSQLLGLKDEERWLFERRLQDAGSDEQGGKSSGTAQARGQKGA